VLCTSAVNSKNITIRHSREGGNPANWLIDLDSRLRGNDKGSKFLCKIVRYLVSCKALYFIVKSEYLFFEEPLKVNLLLRHDEVSTSVRPELVEGVASIHISTSSMRTDFKYHRAESIVLNQRLNTFSAPPPGAAFHLVSSR
jgi:hypothetical protein